MIARGSSGRGLYRISLLLGFFAVAELIFLVWPKLQPLTEASDLIELIVGYINPNLAGRVTESHFLQTSIPAALVWLAAWTALEAFSRSTDELSLWRNIFSDSCWKARAGMRRFFCASIKWAITISTAPLLIVWAIIQRMRHGHQMITVGFVTIDPSVILKYLKHIFLGVAVLISAIMFLCGSVQH